MADLHGLAVWMEKLWKSSYVTFLSLISILNHSRVYYYPIFWWFPTHLVAWHLRVKWLAQKTNVYRTEHPWVKTAKFKLRIVHPAEQLSLRWITTTHITYLWRKCIKNANGTFLHVFCDSDMQWQQSMDRKPSSFHRGFYLFSHYFPLSLFNLQPNPSSSWLGSALSIWKLLLQYGP